MIIRRATLHDRTTQRNHAQPPKFERKPKSISSFVACFKSSTIHRIDDWIDANGLNIKKKFNKDNKLWQPNYHDHIIRNETEYRNISKYIIENPTKWEESEQTP